MSGPLLARSVVDRFRVDGAVLLKGLFADWAESLWAGLERNIREPSPTARYHQDQPYYCVNGVKTCSLWMPLDRVGRDIAVEYIAGSHEWGKMFTPTFFSGAGQ